MLEYKQTTSCLAGQSWDTLASIKECLRGLEGHMNACCFVNNACLQGVKSISIKMSFAAAMAVHSVTYHRLERPDSSSKSQLAVTTSPNMV